MNDKISSDDTIFQSINKMADGNPGAITALNDVIDTKGLKDGFEFMLQLDLRRIYGSDIWIGYKDYCDQNADEFWEAVMEDDEDLFTYIEENSNKN
jgi:hypothetical protein